MTGLFQLIDEKREQLSKHPLCFHLQEMSPGEKLLFIPHMTFFVLGFKDMLDKLKIDNPSTKIEKMINHHCEEDYDHWRMFLKDLKTLNMDIEYWGGDIDHIVSLVWAKKSYAVREQVYLVMKCIDGCKGPHEKLIVVECLEAAFAAFVESLTVYTKKSELFKTLEYFGELHYEQEANHEMGSWLGGSTPKSVMPHQAKYVMRSELMELYINDIFNGFNKVFYIWLYAQKEDYDYPRASLAEAV